MSVEVVVRRRLRSAPEVLCSGLADSDVLAKVPGVRRIDVLEAGADGPTSTGTRRRLHLTGGAFLVEEYVDVTPTRFDYRIRDARPGFRHERGSVVFESRADGGTDATWTTAFSLPVPGAGLAERVAVPAVRLTFFALMGELDKVAGGA